MPYGIIINGFKRMVRELEMDMMEQTKKKKMVKKGDGDDKEMDEDEMDKKNAEPSEGKLDEESTEGTD